MKVIIIYRGDVRIGDDDKRKISEGLHTVGEPRWKQGQGEIGRG